MARTHAVDGPDHEPACGASAPVGDGADPAPGPKNSNRSGGRRAPFYGWVIVGSVFLILAVSSGLGFYNASVILAAATTELDASVGAVSGATGMFFAVGGLSGFVLSRWMDTADIRVFFTAGGALGAVALAGLRWVQSVPALYLFFAVFGVAFGLAGLLPATTLVTRWFDRRRPVALSVASTGLSVGGIVLTPIAAWLINGRGLADAGLPMATLWLLGIVPIGLLLLRSHPSDLGLAADGAATTTPATSTPTTPTPATSTPATPTAVPEPDGATFAEARRTRYFVAICLAYAVIFFGQVGAIAQLFKMVQERVGTEAAGTSLSMLALASVLARLAGGVLVLRLPTRGFTAALALVQAVGLAFLAFAAASTSLVLSSALLGVSIGNLLMLQPLLLAEAFGVRHYSRIYSFNQLFGTIGVAGGPFILGVIRDQADYRTAFLVAAGASLTGCVFLTLAGPTGVVRKLWEPKGVGAPQM